MPGLIGGIVVAGCLATGLQDAASARDWPMWRGNAERTATTEEQLPEKMALRWVRHLPELVPAYRSGRLQFDAGYEPVVSGGLVVVGSSRNDSVSAFDAQTGALRWQTFVGGPVRFAPAIQDRRAYIASDDGCLYCLDLETGRELWKFRAAPSDRKVLGNRRMISVWPVRGGPVVADDRVYFAAGVWPMEGVFVYCLDATSGEVVWRNDRLGFLYGRHPHNTEAIGGLAPQGYLVVNVDELIVPCSTAYPARLNRNTGELVEFELPTPGRLPGGWFAALDSKTARDVRRGKLTFDDVVNRQEHEDKEHKGRGTSGISRILRTAGRELNFDDGYPGVDGIVHSMAVADGRLFVVNRSGSLFCFDDADRVSGEFVVHRANRKIPEQPGNAGFALVVGVEDGDLIRSLARNEQLHVVAIEPDRARVDRIRARFDADGWYGSHVSILQCEFSDADLPPYFASIMATESPTRLANAFAASNESGDQAALDAAFLKLVDSLRPHGGRAELSLGLDNRNRLQALIKQAGDTSFEVNVSDGTLYVDRKGALPGSTNYRGGWHESRDARVRFPLGVLWFDDTLGHFKRSPQPQFIDGVMVSYSKDWSVPMDRGLKGRDYPLNSAVLSDVYTGRIMGESEAMALRKTLAIPDRSEREPSQYRPPRQKDDWNPKQPHPGVRINPLTLQEERRSFPKTYGCDGGVNYGDLFTMRSGTAAFYDMTLESGTVFVSGPRSGCTNSIIPANGLLNIPYYYEGCTCSYPLPVALALVSKGEYHEQWSSWGESEPAAIQRIGINFGAPGDRKTRDGTLWLDYPSVGGPSPIIDVAASPQSVEYNYQHSLFVEGGQGWPWVLGSGAEGLEAFTLKGIKPGRYTVRLCFSDASNGSAGQRVQTVKLQSRVVLQDLDIVRETGGKLRGLVREFAGVQIDGTMTLALQASRGRSSISGIEIVSENLQQADIPPAVPESTGETR